MRPRIKKSKNGWFCYEGDIKRGTVSGREGKTPYQAYMRQQVDSLIVKQQLQKQQAQMLK